MKNKSSLHQNIKAFSETFDVIIENTLEKDLSVIENSNCYHVYDDTGSNRVYANEFMNFNIKNNFTKLASVMNKSCSNTNYTKIQKQLINRDRSLTFRCRPLSYNIFEYSN